MNSPTCYSKFFPDATLPLNIKVFLPDVVTRLLLMVNPAQADCEFSRA
jgi:hypothetical protein